MRKNSGFVLISVLSILSLVSLTLLYLFAFSTWQERVNRNAYRDIQLYQAMNKGFYQIYLKMKANNVLCTRAELSDESILSKPLTWWLSSSNCHITISEVSLNYYLTYLQQDHCVQMSGESVDYWLVTMQAINKQGYTLTSQRTLALPVHAEQFCQDKPRVLHQHWQSWRQLT